MKTQGTRKLSVGQHKKPWPILPLCLGIMTAISSPAYADNTISKATETHPFDIPSQSLHSALAAFAEQSGIQFVYNAEWVKGINSTGIEQNLATDQALQKLLQGTGLTFKYSSNNTIVLERNSQSNANILGTVKVMGKTIDSTDPYKADYTVSNAATATKTDTPIFDTPSSIQVVPKAVMQDKKAVRLKDALENVSGVKPQSSLGFGTSFIIRGFKNDRTYRNGLLANNTFYTEFDTANLESVEVLKGPASVLYGRSEPGGMVNITTKKPLDTPYYSLEQQFGSYDHYRTEWDATGPIANDKSLLYRFTGSYQNNNSFRDLISNDRVMISPTLTWKPTDVTDFTINLEGVEQEFQADYGIPAIGKKPAPIPFRNTFGDPNDPMDHLSKVHVGTELNHKFNDDWAIHNRFLYSNLSSDQVFLNPAPAFWTALRSDNRTMDRNVFFQEDVTDTYATNLDLTGKFQIGQTKHDTLVGFDYTQSDASYHVQGDWENPNPALAIDIYNPRASYGINPSIISTALQSYVYPGKEWSQFKEQWYGAYFQDHITLWDKLHIMGGGRYDWAETGRGRGATHAAAINQLENSSPSRMRKDEGFSPRVGVLYQPWNWLGVYGNWTTSFGTNNGVTANNERIQPEIGEQFEAGVKTDLFDGRLSSTLAYYHLTKNNMMTADLSTSDPYDQLAIGEARSQGIEFDTTGKITDNFSVIGSYAYTDARITKNNDGFVGERLINVPEHSGSVWFKYDFNNYPAIKGLSVGVGGIASGTREGNYSYYGSPFQLPGYVRADAYAAYKFLVNKTKVTAQFNVRNLLDKRYYESTDPDSNVAPTNGIYPGMPLMAVGSIKVEF